MMLITLWSDFTVIVDCYIFDIFEYYSDFYQYYSILVSLFLLIYQQNPYFQGDKKKKKRIWEFGL